MLQNSPYMRVFAYRVEVRNLPIATKALNCSYDGAMKCRVTAVVLEGTTAVVIVEKDGDYPYVEKDWTFVIEEEEGA